MKPDRPAPGVPRKILTIGVTPSSLPPIDSVDVVDLARLDINHVNFASESKSAPAISVVGEPAQAIARLWRALPPGEMARCHTPPFGLRFYASKKLICQGSICWSCNNIYGEFDGGRFAFQFDATHPTSRDLLQMLEKIVGHSASE